MTSPFEEAMQNTMKRLGMETDEDLIKYEKLEPRHFRGLSRKYGFNNVKRYVKIMESRRKGIKRIGEV